jgi:hypothetical protein
LFCHLFCCRSSRFAGRQLQTPVLPAQIAYYFRLLFSGPDKLKLLEFNSLVDVLRSSYCITAGVEA